MTVSVNRLSGFRHTQREPGSGMTNDVSHPKTHKNGWENVPNSLFITQKGGLFSLCHLLFVILGTYE